MNKTGFRTPDEHELENFPMMRSSNDLRDKGTHPGLLASTPPTQEGPEGKQDRMLQKRPQKRWQALLKCLHLLPPIAISLAILSLNFKNVFWGQPTEKTNNILSALQFAASVHASLIVASLSAMVLSTIQYGLASKKGLPLGFLTANFNVDSPTYLFRTEFRSLNLKYFIFFPSLVALALSSGPSSAIAMIPRLQFWVLDSPWIDKGNLNFGAYIQANQTSLYPETLTAEFSAPQCASANASTLPECPSYGIRQWIMDDSLFTQLSTINKTIQGDWSRYLVGTINSALQGSQSSYAASSLSSFLGDALVAYNGVLNGFVGSYFGISSDGTLQAANRGTNNLRVRYDLSFKNSGKALTVRKPLVQVQCTGFPANATAFTLPHGRMSLAPWNQNPIFSTEWNVTSSTYSGLSVDLNSTIVNSSWINIDQFGTVKPSLGVIFATPEITHRAGSIDESTAPWSFFTCTFDTRWMRTETYLDYTSKEQIIYDSFPDPNDSVYSDASEHPGEPFREISATQAYIDESWANLLNGPWYDSIASPTPTNRTILDTIGQKCIDEHTALNTTFDRKNITDGIAPSRIALDTMAIYLCLEVSLSVYLTDGLARAHNSVPIYIVVDGQIHPTSSRHPSSIFLTQDLYAKPDILWLDGERATANTGLTKADFEDSSRFTEIHMRISRYGYGYGFQGSILIYVGVVVLLLHVALSIVYIVWVISLRVYSTEEAGTVGQLVVKAMQSGKLGEAGSSLSPTSDKQIWKERFGLRYAAIKGDAEVDVNDAKSAETVILDRVY